MDGHLTPKSGRTFCKNSLPPLLSRNITTRVGAKCRMRGFPIYKNDEGVSMTHGEMSHSTMNSMGGRNFFLRELINCEVDEDGARISTDDEVFFS